MPENYEVEEKCHIEDNVDLLCDFYEAEQTNKKSLNSLMS